MHVYEIRYPDGTGREIRADGLAYTEEAVTLYAKQEDGRGAVVFYAHISAGVSIVRTA